MTLQKNIIRKLKKFLQKKLLGNTFPRNPSMNLLKLNKILNKK